jgi:hypothetical protein
LLGLFTSTSNTPDAIINDYNPCIGSIGQYAYYTASVNNKILQISNSGASVSTITSPSSSGTITNLYPFFTIDVTIVCEVVNYWIPLSEDFTFIFIFDSKSISASNSIKSDFVTSILASESALTSTLSITTLDANSVIINGINEKDLYPKRKFKLVFSGMKITDAQLETQTTLQMWVLYNNTYSVTFQE